LSNFKLLLKNAHLYKTWANVDDLRAKVHQAVTQEIQLNEDAGSPRPGWHRSVAPSPDAPELTGSRLDALDMRLADLERKFADAPRGVFLRKDPIGRAFEALFPGTWRKTWHLPPEGTHGGWEEAFVTSNVYNVTRTSVGIPIKWRLTRLVEDGEVTRFDQSDPHGRPLFETRSVTITKNAPDHYVGTETHVDQAGVQNTTHVVYRQISAQSASSPPSAAAKGDPQ
jgi:hypothetical protein